MKFKEFLLVEQREYLSEKIGDVLTGVQELLTGGKQIGTRQLVKYSEFIVNQIRKILHSSWPRSEYKYLKKLQKVGVAIMKSIEEQDDLRGTLESSKAEMEKVLEKMGTPINKLAAPSKEEEKPEEGPPPGQQPSPMEQPPTPMQQQPMGPPPAGMPPEMSA